ncbi:hypothetical protein [Coleofasciculus sp.]|uniref:hypothetical protein n=1 Tax=Coleofasciculus sp. TaxID=3100458 RepID=UPI003A123985
MKVGLSILAICRDVPVERLSGGTSLRWNVSPVERLSGGTELRLVGNAHPTGFNL